MAERYVEEVCICGDGSPSDRIGDLRIRIRELPMADGVYASTGCQLWSASVALAQELARRQSLVAGRSVIEVGAGCGLVGIAAACLARSTLITDGDEEVVRNLEHNLRENEAAWRARGAGEVRAQRLDWQELLLAPWPPEARAELLLASDVVYGFWGDTLAQAMLQLLAPGGTILLVASEDRRGGVRMFKEHLAASGFHVEETRLVSPMGVFRFYECRERLLGDPPEHPEVVHRVEQAQPKAARTLDASTPPPKLARVASPGGDAVGEVLRAGRVVWRVVGGLLQGKGIIVRGGVEGKLSEYLGRLAHGSMVEELERTAERLRYRRLTGAGPRDGWVSFLSGRGATLVTQVLRPDV